MVRLVEDRILAENISMQAACKIVAIIGSFAAATFVYVVGSLGRGGATPLKLALSGAATAAACSSMVSAVLLPRTDVMDKFRFWQIGSVGGAQWSQIGMAVPFLVIGLIIVLACATGLNALALGDDVATGLGINVVRTRLLSAVGAVILCGTATAIAGPIAFVGLIVPHVMRLVLGTDHRLLLPMTGLAGAFLLVAADTVGRVVAKPSEVAVGIGRLLVVQRAQDVQRGPSGGLGGDREIKVERQRTGLILIQRREDGSK